MLPLLAVAIADKTSLDSTPEWKAYQAVLAKHQALVASAHSIGRWAG